MRIGVDVGGTNTDAVLVDGHDVLAAAKTPTTPDVTGGIATALHALVESSGEARMLERWLAVERAALARESVPAGARSAPMFSDTPDFVAWTTHRPTLWLTREEYQRLYAHSPRGGRSDLPPPPRPDELWFHEDPHGPERSPGGPPR